MAKPLLRSGNRDDFLARGEGGKKVFDSALQILETLRLRRQHTLLRCLAIPQINEINKRIDWYAPEEGKITSWAAASEEQQNNALHYLENCQRELMAISQHDQRSPNKAAQLFSTLLPQILHFPSPQYIYLVDGLPVITFWGFTRPDDIQNESMLLRIRADIPVEKAVSDILIEPLSESVSVSDITRPTRTEEPDTIVQLSTTPVLQEAEIQPTPFTPDDEHQKSISTRRTPLRYILPLAIAIGAIALVTPQIHEYLLSLIPGTEQTFSNKPQLPVTVEPVSVPFRETLPLQHATEIVAPPAPVASLPPAKVTIPEGALVLPDNSVKAGSTRFLNGNWRVRAISQTQASGRFPSLIYHFYNGTGTAKTISGKTTCTTVLNFGLMPSGNLVIKYKTRAKCNNGSHITFPDVVCRQGLSGPAECVGHIAEAVDIPVNIRRIKG